VCAVGGLSADVSVDDVRERFQRCGAAVSAIEMLKDEQGEGL
jgi:hypothetical protein